MKKTIYLLAIASLAIACGRNSDLILKEEPNDAAEFLATESVLAGLPPLEANYQRKIPDYLRALGMESPQTDNLKAGLGRVLFYDKNLSKDRTISCASCHKQEKAFSDDVAFSTGIEDRQTARNSMPLANTASFSAHHSTINGAIPLLLWDERATSVAEQSRLAFANPDEMGLSMPEVVARVKEQPYYPYLWKQVFGNFDVTENQVLECLSEFVGAIGSHNSKLDFALVQVSGNIEFSQIDADTLITIAYYNPSDTTTTITVTISGLPGFNESENRGRDIFVANCSKCHSPIRPFQEVFAACNGLDESYTDQGLGALTGNPADNGVFKSPSLRNIALTGPYMHDGRFKNLRQVIDFYSDGVKNHPNLHPLMLRGNDPNLHLNAQQKQDLLAFLHTLTDLEICTDSNFSNPFR